MISNDILEDRSPVYDLINKTQDSIHYRLESLLGSTHDLSERPGLVKFLQNAILRCLDVFPRNHILEEAVLVTTQMYTAPENTLSAPAKASRALAKSLLKKDRQVCFILFFFVHQFAVEHKSYKQLASCAVNDRMKFALVF